MAANLNSHFILAPSLEMYFVNKDTGLPLVNGKIYFFKDQEPNIPKSVYQIVSAMPGGPYTYVALPNPVTLSAVGTFQDNNNNDILPYYFPYAGTPDNPGDIELYYIEVYDSLGVLQFTREAWPNLTTSNVETDQDVTNFVPNGQFLLHNNIPASSANTFIAGQVSQATTQIAQGGWSFDRPIGSVATDLVTFTRYPTTENPTGNPRYAVQIQTTVPGADAFKDLRLKYPDVNQFASDTQPYNLYFEAESLTGADINNCQIILIKNYGSGGSPTTEEVKATFSLINGTIEPYNFSFTFGTNTGKSIGPNDDDYLQIAMRLPGNAAQTALFTNFCITVNDEEVTSFPTQTNAQQLDESTAGWLPTPNHDGFDLYLPLRLTPTGLEFDRGEVGKIYATTAATLDKGELLCDGSGYNAIDYSSDGIPYARLQQKLFNVATNGNLFGTGPAFVDSYTLSGSSEYNLLTTNVAGVQSNPVDGFPATGFDFVHNGIAAVFPGTTSIGYRAYANPSAIVTSVATLAGAVAAAVAAGTSGFAVASNTDFAATGGFYSFRVIPVAAAGLAGLYFTFSSTSTNYYMWFKVDGAGVDPAPGGTGIEVDLIGTMSALDVSKVIAGALSSYQVNAIRTKAGATVPAGAYFSFFSAGLQRVVWYTLDGAGTKPAVGNVVYIPVALVTGDTATNVSFKTQVAINSAFVAVPDLRGVFLRGVDTLGQWDAEGTNRFAYYDALVQTSPGTFEVDQFRSHRHAATNGGFGNSTGGALSFPGGGTASIQTNTAFTGSSETVPVNMYVKWVIKY